MHFLKLQVQHGGDVNEMILVTKTNDPTVEELQKHIENQLSIPVDAQRIMFKGQNLHEKRESKLRRFGLTNSCLIRVVGRKQPLQN